MSQLAFTLQPQNITALKFISRPPWVGG